MGNSRGGSGWMRQRGRRGQRRRGAPGPTPKEASKTADATSARTDGARTRWRREPMSGRGDGGANGGGAGRSAQPTGRGGIR